MKYYTPESEEFHPGFEYEILLNSGEWEPIVFQPNDTNFIHRFTEESWFTSEQKSRVKYLDEQDIKDLGWEYVTEYLPDKKYGWTKFKIKTDTEYWLTFYNNSLSIDNNEEYEELMYYFIGTIKNKSELKRLMKQIGITQ